MNSISYVINNIYKNLGSYEPSDTKNCFSILRVFKFQRTERNLNMANKYYLFFGNLANPLKVEIITMLKEKDMSVLEMVSRLDEEQSKISHALKSLKNCSIVNVKNEGKKRIYSLNKKTILPMLEIIDKHEKEFCGKCRALKEKKHGSFW